MQQHGFDCVAERWRELSLTLHRPVRVVDAGGTTEGEAVDIDADGGLLIRTATGMMVKKMAGDVTLTR